MKHTAYQNTAEYLAEQLREAQLDHEAFDHRIKPCELERCRATCCYDGVYLSEEESKGVRRLLLENRDRFQAYDLSLPENPIVSTRGGRSLKTATRDAEVGELAVDFPAHFPRTRCVFLDRKGRCGIQMLSVELGREAWFDKPLTCWIHPLVILPVTRDRSRPIVTLVTPENDPQKSDGYPGFASCTHCGRPDNSGHPAREVLEPELKKLGFISGRDIFGELNADQDIRHTTSP